MRRETPTHPPPSFLSLKGFTCVCARVPVYAFGLNLFWDKLTAVGWAMSANIASSLTDNDVGVDGRVPKRRVEVAL